jgi:non-canonical purine NTP pyrophosphatase (RdgB/HAM1 family)
VSEYRTELLLGTFNAGKALEISTILGDLNLHFRTLRDIGEIQPVAETGKTYEQNASLKAEAYARLSGLLTLADDSGLEVDALDGAPGVWSARYAGLGATDRERIGLLLLELGRSKAQPRTARFVSVVAIADPETGVLKCERGVCTGTIIDSPRGNNGFGYDPIFVPDGFTSTFGELPSSIKDVISHRAQALQAMKQFLIQYLAN